MEITDKEMVEIIVHSQKPSKNRSSFPKKGQSESEKHSILPHNQIQYMRPSSIFKGLSMNQGFYFSLPYFQKLPKEPGVLFPHVF